MVFFPQRLVVAVATMALQAQAQVCPNRYNAGNCGQLMTTVDPNRCSCHNFCNGVFIGCDYDYGLTPCTGEIVCGCTRADIPVGSGSVASCTSCGYHSPPTTVGGGSVCVTCPVNSYPQSNCPTAIDQCVCNVGFFRPSPGGDCVPCLSCGSNAFPKTNCVIDTTDPNQCGCYNGFTPNYTGQCVPVAQTQVCQQCPYNLISTVSCVTSPDSQCVCPAGQVQRNGQWCFPVAAASPVAPSTVYIGKGWNNSPPVAPSPAVVPAPTPVARGQLAPIYLPVPPSPVYVPGPVSGGQLVPVYIPVPPSYTTARTSISCSGKGKGKGTSGSEDCDGGGKGSGSESSYSSSRESLSGNESSSAYQPIVSMFLMSGTALPFLIGFV